MEGATRCVGITALVLLVLGLFGGQTWAADPHCCIPATCTFRTETFTNTGEMPPVQLGVSMYDETRGVSSHVLFANDTFQVIVTPQKVYVVNITDNNKCFVIGCGEGSCFTPYCTNSTDWGYVGVATVGVEKVNRWEARKFPGNMFLQPKPGDGQRCLPIAFTSAMGKTQEQLRYTFMWWSDVKEKPVPPSAFTPPATCQSHKRMPADHIARDHPALMNYIEALTSLPLSA